MKKTASLLFIVLSVILASCVTYKPTENPIPTSTKTFAPTVTPKPIEIPTTTDEPEINNMTPDTIVGQWLSDPQQIWSENTVAMAENQGGQFGSGSNKNYIAEQDVFSFTDSGGMIWTRLNTSLDKWEGGDSRGNQAILVKWQAFSPSALGFTFIGMNSSKEFSVQFGNPCQLNRIEGIEQFTGDVMIEEGVWFYTLMAMDRDGNFRSIIWRADDPEKQSSYQGAFGEEYANDSWRFIFGSSAPMTLNVKEYAIYAFSGFAQ